jgi:hypothetical protein
VEGQSDDCKNYVEQNAQWCGFSVKETKNGFMTEQWSAETGTKTGAKVLYGFCDQIPAGTDLTKNWNDMTTVAEAIFYGYAAPVKKIIKNGRKVF